MAENKGDPMGVLFDYEPDNQDAPQQKDFFRNVKIIATQAIEAARQYKQTKVFSNLCRSEILEEWNELQRNELVQILDVHNIPAPKSAELIDAIRVDFVRIDENIFHMALVKEMSEAGHYLPDYLSAVRPGELKDILIKVSDLGEGAQYVFRDNILKKFRYTNVRMHDIKEFIGVASAIIDSGLYNNTEETVKPVKKKGGQDAKKKG